MKLYIAIPILLVITCFYGYKIYESATHLNGKLAWTLHRLQNEKSVTFEHNNLFKDGIEGIFQDINKKHPLPATLYMENNFELTFMPDGKITSFYTFVYGKNADGEVESFLIDYDHKKSDKITVWLNGYVPATFQDDKLVEPLLQTVKAIPMEQTVQQWGEKQYGLVYYGKRDWGSNTAGILNVYTDGKVEPIQAATSEIIGYTVSIFVPGKEKDIMPARFHLQCDLDWCKSKTPPEQSKPENPNAMNEQFFLSNDVGFRLNVADKALGSTFYSLSKTIDGGITWEVINPDPFSGTVGSVSGITFINEKVGFLASSNVSGTTGALFRTNDGGLSYQKINYPPHEVTLSDGQLMEVFDCPRIPSVEDDILKMLVGQGADGDYNGNSSALYQSVDQGETWEYVEEVK